MIYTQIREINRGGFGIVEEVEDIFGDHYARKTFHPSIVLPPDEQEKMRKRFVREVKWQATFPIEYVLPILDSDLEADPPWFVMPLAEKTYKDQIVEDKQNNFPAKEPLADILNGLDELHTLGFVHRDLKPGNIMLHDGKWKLADFGLVMPPSDQTTKLTSYASAWGTEHYMAPEQAQGFGRVTAAADIYSFGCMLHDLVSSVPRIPYSRHSVSGPLGLIVERCTEVDLKRRFKSISALRGALLAVLAEPLNLTKSAEAAEWVLALREIAAWKPHQVADLALFLQRQAEATGLWEVCSQLDEDTWQALYDLDRDHADAIAECYCEWAKGDFSWEYCDVLVRRLEKIAQFGDLATKSGAVIAAACLGRKHNRWYVMKRMFTMCSPNADDTLARRLGIDIQAFEVEYDFWRCASVESRALDVYHPAIAAAVRAKCGETGE